MMSGRRRKKEIQKLYILTIPPGLASSLFIASHMKVSFLTLSTADIVISPAEVIHHQCNISLSPRLSYFCFIFITMVASLLLHPLSLSPSVLFQPFCCHILFLTALAHVLHSKTSVGKPTHLTHFQRQCPSLKLYCKVSWKLSNLIIHQPNVQLKERFCIYTCVL